MADDFFPPRPIISPTIYAYEDNNPQYAGMIKVGYTSRDVQTRLSEIYPLVTPGKPTYKILLTETAMRNDGTAFDDNAIHRILKRLGVQNPAGEWFECGIDQVISAILEVRTGVRADSSRTLDFGMRPEQEDAVSKTCEYFKNIAVENKNATSHFLWNAKMRFGKTFASYQLAKRMKWKRVLVLTFKPAVQSAWEEDLLGHIDFEGWQFISPGGLKYEDADMTKPFVCFGSFQDYLGRNPTTGGIKTKNKWVHEINWDLVVLDEYHYGAWRDTSKELFANEDEEWTLEKKSGLNDFDEDILPITTKAYLYLSGTPFRAISSGEFIEDQIFNWTYTDEQRAKSEWTEEKNPYAALPRMVLLTYQLPELIQKVALQGEFNEFDLNLFFSAAGLGSEAKFRYESEVQKWLDLTRGSFGDMLTADLKLGFKKPPMPFGDVRLLEILTHTLWFLPNVASCFAMNNLLSKRQNSFFNDFEVIVAAGPQAGIGVEAIKPVERAMKDPLKTRTITLTCAKLLTGVTVRPWSGIFMLLNLSSPETYFQAAFRVQSPWTIKEESTDHAPIERVIKSECYVFDFAPERALRQIADYSCRLNINETNPEEKVQEFINFLPVLAYDGSSMKQIDAAGVLEMAMSGTTATLLARRFDSALLVNVDDMTLKRLLNNKTAMDALMNIVGFRNLREDIETVINKSEAVKKMKKDANDKDVDPAAKREISNEEKEYKSLRKQIQDKLRKFATRIPVFLYLTDYRERSLFDVITQLEPGLFMRVTGLQIKDFELLLSLGVFNVRLMNDAIFKFKRYEDSSLSYLGINRHEGEDIGLFDTVISREDAEILVGKYK